MSEPAMVGVLQEAITQRTLVPLVEQVLTEAGVSPASLAVIVFAGNTTMLHLLAGVDPSPLGTAPFTPVFLEHRLLTAHDLSLDHASTIPTFPRSGIRSPPVGADASVAGCRAYVGADITAGVLSSGMAYRTDTCLLVDVGTNGEIVLKHGDRFLGCATAAGPAFEGAGLNCGVRADAARSVTCGWKTIPHIRTSK